MAVVVVTMRVMPEGLDIDLKIIEDAIKNIFDEFVDGEMRMERKPVAFGLNAIEILFTMDESKNLEDVENLVSSIAGVQSVNVTDVRRAIG